MIKNLVVFVCDNCGAELHTEEDDFDAARDVFKNEGWQFLFREGKKHYCPDCKIYDPND